MPSSNFSVLEQGEWASLGRAGRNCESNESLSLNWKKDIWDWMAFPFLKMEEQEADINQISQQSVQSSNANFMDNHVVNSEVDWKASSCHHFPRLA
ncbi:hypothetical protein DITRI_Ditri11bG0178500 [Diplodiscus trichospermus]